MWRVLAKYNEAQNIIRNHEKELETERELDENEITNEKEIKKKEIKNKIIQNKIQEDLLNNMKTDYLSRTNYTDYNSSTPEIKEIYNEIYMKIFNIHEEQKQLKIEYEKL
jgi:hypothetical protein